MQESTPMMTIGVLSRQTGCKVETIRYYEQTGLVTPPLRSAGGHRQFDGAANGHLAEVRTRLSDLAALETALADMVHLCRGGTMPDCPIIEALSDRA
jgi:MerR family mercuric resistance operon transcriptional regulator